VRERPDPLSPNALRSLALRLLGRRDYTATELQEKLLAKGGVAADVEALLADLRERNLLDDRRAAAAHVRTSTRVKLRGRRRVAMELSARGVDPDLAGELLRDVAPEDEAAAIATILTRKHIPARLTPDDRRRIFQHLLRRGFSSDAITKALKEWSGRSSDRP
jgi:regulatory protein